MNGRDTEPKRNPMNSFVGGCQLFDKDGSKVYNPHYIHIGFNLEKFLAKHGIYAYQVLDKLPIENKQICLLVFHLNNLRFCKTIKWRKQYNVFKDRHLKLLPIPSADGKVYYNLLFDNVVEFISWCNKHGIEDAYGYDDFDLFYHDKSLLLPSRIHFEKKVK